MNEFSDQTASCLSRSGWTPETVVDTEEYERVLKEGGFMLHPAALAFLKKYGGFRFYYPHAKVKNMGDEMHFDVLIVTRHTVAATVAIYGKLIGKELCPIGEAARGYLMLMMDEAGVVYASFDDLLLKVGVSGSDAIEAFCSGRELETISEDALQDDLAGNSKHPESS